MGASSFQAFGDLAASDLTNTVKAGRHAFQAEAEEHIAYNIASRLELSKDDNLLDIGCGTGNVTIRLLPYVKSITVVDHPNVVDALLARPAAMDRIYGHRGDWLRDGVDAVEGKCFHKILIYSVLHYLSFEKEVWSFLESALDLLWTGGKLMVGDIPNIDRKRRFEATTFGAAFSKAWAARSNGSDNKHFATIAADENRIEFDDAMILRLMKELELGAKDYIVLPQPSTLPFGHTREDIIITNPG